MDSVINSGFLYRAELIFLNLKKNITVGMRGDIGKLRKKFLWNLSII